MEIPYTVEARPDTGLYNAKMGIWLFLASEVMLFDHQKSSSQSVLSVPPNMLLCYALTQKMETS